MDKTQWIDKSELLFRLTAARNVVLGTQHHDPQEVCAIFDAVIDFVQSMETREEGRSKKSGKRKKKCIHRRKLSTENKMPGSTRRLYAQRKKRRRLIRSRANRRTDALCTAKLQRKCSAGK